MNVKSVVLTEYRIAIIEFNELHLTIRLISSNITS